MIWKVLQALTILLLRHNGEPYLFVCIKRPSWKSVSAVQYFSLGVASVESLATQVCTCISYNNFKKVAISVFNLNRVAQIVLKQ